MKLFQTMTVEVEPIGHLTDLGSTMLFSNMIFGLTTTSRYHCCSVAFSRASLTVGTFSDGALRALSICLLNADIIVAFFFNQIGSIF